GVVAEWFLFHMASQEGIGWQRSAARQPNRKSRELDRRSRAWRRKSQAAPRVTATFGLVERRTRLRAMSAAAPARQRGRSPRPSAAISRAAAARTRRSAFTSTTRGGAPSPPLEGANPSHPDLHSFGTQQLTLDLQVSAVAADGPARRDDAMAGDARVVAGAHDVADRARGQWFPRQRGDVAVGRDPPGRNP